MKVEFTEVDRVGLEVKVLKKKGIKSALINLCRKSDLRMGCWLGVQREGGDGGPEHRAKASAMKLGKGWG